MALREAGSTPVEASSIKTTFGLPISAMARHSLRLFPPESAPALVLMKLCKPTFTMIDITWLDKSLDEIPAMPPNSVSVYITVKSGSIQLY